MGRTRREQSGQAIAGYGRPRGEREVANFADVASACFNLSDEDARAWFRKGDVRNVRLQRDGDAVAAGLLLVPMGQWFGGRSVPMTGIAGVGVPAERRGRGWASRLMRATLAELRAQGVALSTLYPATTALYRDAGYEVAGGRYALSIHVPALRSSAADRELVVRRATPADEPAIAAVAADVARRGAGQLDRGEYIWRRVRQPKGRIVRDLVIEGGRGLEGYAYLSQREAALGEGHGYEIVATDAAALTPAAGRRLFALLADHAGISKRVVLYGGPTHPLLAMLPERHFGVELVDPWMLRIVDLRAALQARGWPAGLRAELRLEVSDDVLPQNAGLWRLSVADGAARAERVEGGERAKRVKSQRAAGGARRGTARARVEARREELPLLRLDVRGLAPLYSGHLSPGQLQQTGLLDGEAPALELAAALFAGPAPSMSDMF